MCNNLKILHLNVNGLRNKLHEVTAILCKHSPDILAITESRLDQSIPDGQIVLDGYNFLRSDRLTSNGGGLVIYFKLEFSFSVLVSKLSDCESVHCSIALSRRKSLKFVVVYRPPSGNLNRFIQSLDSFLSQLDPTNSFLMIGDMNIDLLDVSNNHVLEYSNILKSHSCTQILSEPTREGKTRSSLLDHIVTHSLDVTTHFIDDVPYSDHKLVGLTWFRAIHNQQYHHTVSLRRYELLNPRDFNDQLGKINWYPFWSSNDADFKCNFLNKAIIQALDFLIPIKTFRIKYKTKHKPWINGSILKDIGLRDKLYKRYKATGDRSIKQEFITLKNRVNSSIRRAKFYYFRNKLASNSSNQAWSFINSWRKSNKATDQQICPNVLAKHYCDYPKKLHDEINSVHHFSSFLENRTCETFIFKDISTYDISLCFKELNSSKSSGHDGINNFIWKSACPFIVQHLISLFNCCLSTSSLPIDWKIAIVRPIFKRGSKTDPKNYRPISLLPSLSKIFEKLIHKQMIEHLEIHQLINPNQHGFRKNHSTTSAITNLTDFVFKSFDSKQSVPTILLDLSAAFDCVDHTILKYKLGNYGFRGQALSLLSFYLHERKFRVKTDSGKLSDLHTFSLGVPQGSVLGPLFFILFINDFSNCLYHCKSIHYADDTAIYSTTSNIMDYVPTITNDLLNAGNWFRANKLKLNFKKSQFVIFSSSPLLQRPTLFLDAIPIEPTDSVNYLGVILDSALHFNEHVSHICSKVSRTLGTLRHIGYLLPLSARKLVYKALVLPHFNYCSTIWSSASAASINRLNVLLNKVCRAVLLVKWDQYHAQDLYRNLDWLTIDQLLTFNLWKVGFKIVHTSHPLSRIMPNLNEPHLGERSRRNFLNFVVPRHSSNFGLKSPSYRILRAWNSLPLALKQINYFPTFKKLSLAYLKQNR